MLRTNATTLCIILAAVLAAVLIALAACGEVATPRPTATPPRVAGNTPTVTLPPALRPTSTAPIEPPPDTATPTITPTPIVHIVQAGETLLGIALDYGVDVDRLQAVNDIEDPRYLRVGQELVIPTGEEATDDTPGLLLPTPTPMPFGVRGVAFYETPVGSLWCLGEIVNTAPVTITNVQVRVTLFAEAGQPVARVDAFAAADLIPPGQRSPFGILFTSPPVGWASSQVVIVRGEAAGEMATSYVPIAVTEATGQPSGPQFQVSGSVQNTSPEQAAGSVHVIATTYDDQGMVTGFRQGSVPLDEPLTPGATAPFSLLFNFHGDEPADYHVIALGRAPAE